MLGIPRRFSHFVFGFIQSGLTRAIAAAIASWFRLPIGLPLSRLLDVRSFKQIRDGTMMMNPALMVVSGPPPNHACSPNSGGVRLWGWGVKRRSTKSQERQW